MHTLQYKRKPVLKLNLQAREITFVFQLKVERYYSKSLKLKIVCRKQLHKFIMRTIPYIITCKKPISENKSNEYKYVKKSVQYGEIKKTTRLSKVLNYDPYNTILYNYNVGFAYDVIIQKKKSHNLI